MQVAQNLEVHGAMKVQPSFSPEYEKLKMILVLLA
jgi:hypothetical protein